jgi:hypothetical protein
MKSKLKSTFNPQVYPESAGVSRKVAEFRRKQAIFSQGDAADNGTGAGHCFESRRKTPFRE